ncbi:hypothetical protein DFS33DRAFT_1377853 [Desarmillaria ectypa]|nr:hypothetical protein DFS33DRAFT_1377853 [Desarmillaria ectypa]
MSFPGGPSPSDWELGKRKYSLNPGSNSQTTPLRSSPQLQGFQPQDPLTTRWNNPPQLSPRNMSGMYGLCLKTPCLHTLSPNIPTPTPQIQFPIVPLGPYTLMILEQTKTISTDPGTVISKKEALGQEKEWKLDAMTMATPFPADSPFNINGANYNWPMLSDIDRTLFSPFRATTWKMQRDDIET